MAKEGGSISSLLVVVLDVNPVWWGRNLVRGDQQLTLSRCVDSMMVLANSHLMMNHLNKVAVIAAHSNSSYFIYPKRESLETDGSDGAANGEMHDGKYELFDRMNAQVKDEIKELVLHGNSNTEFENDSLIAGAVSMALCYSNTEFENDSLIAGAVSMALCYIHRQEKECLVGVTLSSRVLVIKGCDDNPAQYMNFMNTVFTAQKQNVVIDACILENDSGLLQQACDITGGIYLKVPQPSGLLQYLLWVFLPDPGTRETLTLPPKAQVDYRAACFCHRHLIDIGYVCSVCLSIFCTFSPICSTCQTTFKIKGPMKMVKKKSKKSSSAT